MKAADDAWDAEAGETTSHRNGRTRRDRRRPSPGQSRGDSLANAWDHALEVVDRVRALIAVRADRAALELQRKLVRAGLIFVAAIAVATMLISASLRTIDGLANGLAELFGHPWLGNLAAGVLVLGGLAGIGALGMRRWEKKELEERIQKYERLHEERRARRRRRAPAPTTADGGTAPPA